MNNDFNLLMAERFAERLQQEANKVPKQIEIGFHLSTGRMPTQAEQSTLVQHTHNHGLKNTCRLLLNLSELMFVD